MQSAVFDPLLLAVNLHPTPLTWDLSLIGAFLLGAAAGYLFGRVLGLQVIPAVVSSAAFSLSGWFFLYNNNQFSRSYVFLPLLFLLVELTPRSRRWWPVLGLGVAVAENIYIGMPEASFFVIGAAAIYGAVRLVQQRKEMPVRVSLARLGGGGLLGLLLAAPVLLLFLQYERLSFNVHKPEFSAGSQIIDYWGVLRWIVPYFVDAGVPTIGWFGAAVVIAALAAVSGRTETKRCHAWLFLALGIFLLAKIYDLRVTQTLTSWVGRLPGAELVIFPTFAAPVVSFAFAVLAGIGVQVLWTRDLHLKRFLALLAAAFALSSPSGAQIAAGTSSPTRFPYVRGVRLHSSPPPPSLPSSLPPGSDGDGARRSSPWSSSPSSSCSRPFASTRREPIRSALPAG